MEPLQEIYSGIHFMNSGLWEGFQPVAGRGLVLRPERKRGVYLSPALDGGRIAEKYGWHRLTAEAEGFSKISIRAWSCSAPKMAMPSHSECAAGEKTDLSLWKLQGRYLRFRIQFFRESGETQGVFSGFRIQYPAKLPPGIALEEIQGKPHWEQTLISFQNSWMDWESGLHDHSPFSCPYPLLRERAGWLGIRLPAELGEPAARSVMSRAGLLLRLKGTANGLRLAGKLATGEMPVVWREGEINPRLLIYFRNPPPVPKKPLEDFLRQFAPLWIDGEVAVVSMSDQRKIGLDCFLNENSVLDLDGEP